jgi:hypothetical protein
LNAGTKMSTLPFFFVVKGPAADAMDAPQPWSLLCNPVMKTISFFVFPCNRAPVEWNWQGKAEVLGKKPVRVILSTTNPTWIDPGLRGERPATNCLSHGTASTFLTARKKISRLALWFHFTIYLQKLFSTASNETRLTVNHELEWDRKAAVA